MTLSKSQVIIIDEISFNEERTTANLIVKNQRLEN